MINAITSRRAQNEGTIAPCRSDAGSQPMVVGASIFRGRAPALFSIFAGLVGLAAFGGLAIAPAQAADASIFKRGDAVVTGFSGVKTDKEVPADVHPLDRTFIDLDGPSAQVFDLTVLGSAPRGQLSDVPSKLQIKARDVGQVFGVTLDDGDGRSAPNAYLTATSMYGLNAVLKDSAGKLNRLVTGEAGAQWMPGQFGLEKGGSPGAIYKVDGTTGAVSLFATIKLNGRDNAGAALGNITFDARTRQLFVSDVETGMIHRITLDGKERDVFDHGVVGRKAQGLEPLDFEPAMRLDITKPSFNSEDPKTWGYADPRRRVFGLAVNSGRLYYSVGEGPSVWSVAIDAEGDFGIDARIELEVKGTPSEITDVLFDGSGMLYLAQRGGGIGSYDYSKFADKQKSAVLRYRWDAKDSRWAEAADEFAVGLPEDYRGTVGGVASSYGYDKFGNVDFGKCRQTLWSTGEHLREGKDKDKILSGGARVVHGLQGMYKSRALPANAPPTQSWFTDYDGRHADADAFGHIGDVAIFAPCEPGATPEPSASVEISPPLIYIDPPADEPGLVIDKHCHPGAIGGNIRCTITVTNLGAALPIEDVKVKDVTKIMFGPGAGAIVPIVGFSPLGPGIACTPVPSLNFSCVIPAVLLVPGLSAGFDVFIDTHDLALAGNLGFRNCASINHPNGWGKACAEGGTDILVEKVGPATCLPGGTCKFGLKIFNAGTMPFNGDVLLADAMFIGGGVPVVPVTSVAPPILCSAGNTAQLPFTCVTPLSLMPGEEHTHWIEVTMPAPGGYWAQNCFGALDPALLPVGPVPPGLGGGGPGAGNPSCVWVHVKVPTANLAIQKTALHGGMCAKVGPDLLCDYEIKLTNENAALFSAPLKVEEKMPAGAAISSVSAPWACAGGPPVYSCDTGAAVNIPAGGSTSFNVTIKIPVVASEANFCLVPNKVKILVPLGGAAPNLDPADDTDLADAWTTGITWEDPITHIWFVMCDPTNQKVKKVVSSPFVKTGSGFEGAYEVTITNTGPDPYKGPYKLTEKFGVAPTSVSFDGDFTCSGGGADYTCETPVKDVPKNGVVKLKIKATFPDNGTCEAPNTATLTMPPAGSKGNGDGSDDSASATAHLPSERCTKQSKTPLPPVVSRCPDGLPVPRSGKCPCTEGKTYVRASGTCAPDESNDEPQGCTPGIHEVKIGARCVCAEGYTKDDGRCVKDEPEQPQGCQPGPHESKTQNGRCLCDDGYSRNDGRCVKDQDEPQHPQGCQAGPHESKTPNGRCLCDDGYSRADNGRCVRDNSPADDCKDKGWRWTGSRCVPPSNPAEDCKESGRLWRNGQCVDPPNPGQECREDGGKWTGSKCVYPPKECPDGYAGTPPNCRKIPAKACPDGTHGNWPNCKKDYTEPPKQPKHCPRGMLGEPPECYWPKPGKDDDDQPKKKKFDIEIFKKQPRGNNGDGPVFKQKPNFNINPGIFQKK